MADKFLDSVEMEQLKKEIKMTRLGKMLYDDGRAEGRAEGKAEGESIGESKVMILIQKMSADGAAELIPRLTTDAEFYKAMLQKYSVEV